MLCHALDIPIYLYGKDNHQTLDVDILFVVICQQCMQFIYRGSYMSAHVLLNLLNDLGKR